jgi:hypothetical protein
MTLVIPTQDHALARGPAEESVLLMVAMMYTEVTLEDRTMSFHFHDASESRHRSV